MRKKIILIVIVIITATSLMSQGLSNKGIKLGLNLAKFIGEDSESDDDKSKLKLGFAFGGFVTYNVNMMFSLQPEAYYFMQGSKQEMEHSNLDGALLFKLNYIQIPLLAKIKLSHSGFIIPNLLIGPALAINTSATYEYTDELGNYMQLLGYKKTGDLEDVNPIDFELIIGTEINIGLALVDIRYNWGLTKVDKNDADLKNSTFSFLLGYKF